MFPGHVRLQVEDDETPEMIMAKFAELERIKAAAEAAKSAASACPAGDVASKPPAAAQEAPAGHLRPQLAQQQGQQQLEHQEGEEQGAGAAGEPTLAAAAAAAAAAIRAAEDEGGLTDEQLLEVFKQTSMFNVRTALQDNEMLLGIDELLEAASERCARGGTTPPSTACRTGLAASAVLVASMRPPLRDMLAALLPPRCSEPRLLLRRFTACTGPPGPVPGHVACTASLAGGSHDAKPAACSCAGMLPTSRCPTMTTCCARFGRMKAGAANRCLLLALPMNACCASVKAAAAEQPSS